MTERLPVKTYMLRSKKKYGPIIGAILFLFVSFIFFYLAMGLDRITGKFLCLILFLFTFIIALFCIAAFVYLKKENFIGFFISSEGFNDISTGHRYGIVQWRDVVKIRIVDDLDHKGKKYISLKLKNPQEYIAREPVQHKKRSLELKYHYYGSPICFSNRGINCSFEELESTIRMYYNNYREREESVNPQEKT